MVLLTVTPTLLEGLKARAELAAGAELEQVSGEPSLETPEFGSPISHGQVVDLWRLLAAGGREEYSLESLLKGSMVYIPPPPPKPEPVGYARCFLRPTILITAS